MKTDFSAAFYSVDKDKATLAKRITLLEEQVDYARQEKDNLLDFLKAELSDRLGIKVGYWIQGSFKNHTVIRPVRKNDEFDVDVGLYLFIDADAYNLKASDLKSTLHKVLDVYCQNHGEAKLEDPKPNCERVSFSGGFHIDLPLYFVDEATGKCRLATENNGWIDSDPKSLQAWFKEQLNHLSDSERARLRRVIKALKTWVCLKRVTLPSIAISCYVARNYQGYDSDEMAIWSIANSITNHLIVGGNIHSPINGDDLIGAQGKELEELRDKCVQFQRVLSAIELSSSLVISHQLWSIEFEHIMPPLNLVVEPVEIVNLPAITNPPRISVKLYNGGPEQVMHSVSCFRGDNLDFRVNNTACYPPNAEVIWMVRNTDTDAFLENDLGHKQRLAISQIASENCEYHGKHYMECTVLSGGNILGVSAVEVNIHSIKRPMRNPPKKLYGPRR